MCAVRTCGVGGLAGVEECHEGSLNSPARVVGSRGLAGLDGVSDTSWASLMEGCLQKRAQKGSETFGPYVGHRGRQFSTVLK